MKPRKKWEPLYRFGGNKASYMVPAPLGTTVPWKYPNAKKKKK